MKSRLLVHVWAPAVLLALPSMSFSSAIGAMPTDPAWGDILVKLAQVGFIGAAIALFLLGAVVLIWGKEGSPNQAQTKRLYLVLAFLSVVIAAGTHMWDTRVPGTVILSFSPDFQDEGLPSPRIYTSAGDKLPGQPIDVSKDRILVIYVDQLIKAVRQLRGSVATAQKTSQATQGVLAKYAADLAKKNGDGVVDPVPTN